MNWERGRSWGWGGGVKRNRGMIPTPGQRRPLQSSPAQPSPSVVRISICLAHNPGTPVFPNSCSGLTEGPRKQTLNFLSFLLYIWYSLRTLHGEPLCLLSLAPDTLTREPQLLCGHTGDIGMGLTDGDNMCSLVTNVFFF